VRNLRGVGFGYLTGPPQRRPDPPRRSWCASVSPPPSAASRPRNRACRTLLSPGRNVRHRRSFSPGQSGRLAAPRGRVSVICPGLIEARVPNFFRAQGSCALPAGRADGVAAPAPHELSGLLRPGRARPRRRRQEAVPGRTRRGPRRARGGDRHRRRLDAAPLPPGIRVVATEPNLAALPRAPERARLAPARIALVAADAGHCRFRPRRSTPRSPPACCASFPPSPAPCGSCIGCCGPVAGCGCSSTCVATGPPPGCSWMRSTPCGAPEGSRLQSEPGCRGRAARWVHRRHRPGLPAVLQHVPGGLPVQVDQCCAAVTGPVTRR
jgi:hypothetical protein